MTVLHQFSPTFAVRSSCRQWMGGGETVVAIDCTALDKFAAEIAQSILANESLEVTEWDAEGWHYTGKNYRKGGCDDNYHELMRVERVALYVLALDAINFCFWPLSPESENEATHTNGLEYEHLAVALRKVAEADDGESDENGLAGARSSTVRAASSYALSPANLSELTPRELHCALHQHFPRSSEGIVYQLPNTETRCRLLNELGKGLLDQHDGSASRMIAKAGGSADALIAIVLDTFPGFRDYARANGHGAPPSSAREWESAKSSPSAIHFHKRAQIAVADIWAALGGRRCGDSSSPSPAPGVGARARICQFDDMALVTTFPDYRVPQILRHVGVLRYGPPLASSVDARAELERGGVDEVSIRAGTVVAVDKIVQRVKKNVSTAVIGGVSERTQSELRRLAEDVSAVTIDWYLWQSGEKLDRSGLLGPHHRVRTTFY